VGIGEALELMEWSGIASGPKDDGTLGAGIYGYNNGSGAGVVGSGDTGPGVKGESANGVGVLALSNTGDGLQASTVSADRSGIFGRNDSGQQGRGVGGNGVFGLTLSPGAAGLFGSNNAPNGSNRRGVQGNGPDAGVAGWSETGVGVLAQSGNIGIKAQAPTAGHFDGDVEVTGEIRFVGGDCAESFAAVDTAGAKPGTVMVLDDSGAVRVADDEYDRRAVGVVSGAGEYRPALMLDSLGSAGCRLPLAIMGKVYCKVDARATPITVGDLLTTSSTPGHAMKAVDPARAFGAVIGKALQACSGECGLIPILVALQ
jgi:hypothetical protein